MSPELLLGTRFALHVATVLVLASYYRPQPTMRLGVSVCAGLLLASSSALAVQILTTWHLLAASSPQPQLVFFTFAVFLPIAIARGNLARVIDALKHLAATGTWRW